jgi:hypothetical protein
MMLYIDIIGKIIRIKQEYWTNCSDVFHHFAKVSSKHLASVSCVELVQMHYCKPIQ